MILRKKRRTSFQFEMIPVNLIDLFLVILIFFVTTTTFLKVKSIELDLPDSTSASSNNYLNVNVLNVGKDGRFFFNAREYGLQELIARMREIKTERPQAVFQLGADKDSLHSQFIKAMDALSAAGIQEIAIATKG